MILYYILLYYIILYYIILVLLNLDNVQSMRRQIIIRPFWLRKCDDYDGYECLLCSKHNKAIQNHKTIIKSNNKQEQARNNKENTRQINKTQEETRQINKKQETSIQQQYTAKQK